MLRSEQSEKRRDAREKRRQDESAATDGGGELILARTRASETPADAAAGARETREEAERRNGQTIEPLD